MVAQAKLEQLGRAALREGSFCADRAAEAGRIPRDFPGDFAAHLQSLIDSGEARCLDMVNASGAVVGWLVLADEENELVILAAAGRDGSDLTAAFLPLIENLARSEGFSSVRFHTARPGLVEKTAARHGYHVSEIVLRKKL